MQTVKITDKNLDTYDHCLIKNKKMDGYIAKCNWIKSRLKEGLVIKRMVAKNGETMGFIEYLPIEKAWRAVAGKNYLFIHCLFTYPTKYQGQGVGSSLINECIKDAKSQKKDGVAVITSTGSFMADKRIFAKLGFHEVHKKDNHQLLALQVNKKALPPKLENVDKIAQKYQGLHLFYSDQCPSLAKPIKEIIEVCQKEGIKIKVHYIEGSKNAQNAPFISGTFGVVYNGKTYAERCISKTRFLNIVNKLQIT